MSHIRLLSQILFFTLLVQAAHAKENVADVDPFFQEMPIVLTASRLAQPLSEAPSPMTVIDKNMIKASGFRTVPELMNLVPGMYVGYVDGNTPVLSLHNSTDQYSRQMQVLIDGRSVYMPPLGGVNWSSLPILFEDIERIEVVRGPSAASHGTNSFYGVINIITREATGGNGGRVSVTGGYATDASASLGRNSEQFDYRITAGYRADRGYSNDYLNDHNQTRVANFRGNYHPNSSDSLDVQLGASNGVYGKGIMQTIGHSLGQIRDDNLYRDATGSSSFQQIAWLHIWPTGNESKLTYSHTTVNTFDPRLCTNTSVCNPRDPTTAYSYVPYSVYGQRDVLELQNTHQLNDSNRLVWGASTERAYASNPQLLISDPKVNSWQIFAHDEWRMSANSILNVGTMFEDNGMGYQSNAPRASFNYHITPQHTVRIGVTSATRSPAMMERYIDDRTAIFGGGYSQPTTPLLPEKIISKEIGYIGEFPTLNMTLSARVYIDQVSDMILVDKCVDGTLDCSKDSWKNIGYAEFKGVETTLKYFWDDKHSFLTANYVYQRATLSLGSLPSQYYGVLAADVQAYYKNENIGLFAETVMSNSGSLLLSQRIADSWQLSAGYYFRAPIRVLDVATDVTPEKRMRRLDMRLAKTFKLEKGRSAEVAAILQNVSQDEYTKYDTLNAEVNVLFTRRGWVTASFNF
ncbi:MAG: TonB-dependent receptor [Gallionellaceae bacterium]